MTVRLHITVEGQTEERFVKQVLAPFFAEHRVWADARCVLTSKDNRARIAYRRVSQNSFPAVNMHNLLYGCRDMATMCCGWAGRKSSFETSPTAADSAEDARIPQ